MMRRLLKLYEARKVEIWSLVAPVAVFSAVTHTALIGAWIYATLPSASMARESIANHIFYIPPPDRVMARAGSGEKIHFIQVNVPGAGLAAPEASHETGNLQPVAAPKGPVGNQAHDSVATPSVAPTVGTDSVFSVLEVDTAVVRSENSAAPAYPLKMLHERIGGEVKVRYIVDTTGFADTTSFRVLSSTNEEFTDAVREALPYMRFSPAKIGKVKVRQLVEQSFGFRIADSSAVKPSPKKP